MNRLESVIGYVKTLLTSTTTTVVDSVPDCRREGTHNLFTYICKTVLSSSPYSHITSPPSPSLF